MPIGKSTEESTRTGVYIVKESGLDYEHIRDEITPKDGKEYLERFRQRFSINVMENKDNNLVFELIGCDASFANALRRILLSEVPTVAIENVYMWNNTSIIHDEVLSHRLGLIPIDVDARLFDPLEEGDDATDRNTLVFQLQVKCPSRRQAVAKSKKKKDGDDDDEEALTETEKSVLENSELDRAAYVAAKKEAIQTPGRPYTLHLYSKDLVWMPQGDQEKRFPNGIRPVHDDILIAKLRPGQEIELEAHARYGLGQDHAKYSPVATAAYRLYTEVEIVEPIYDEDAEQLAHLYEPGVFELIPATDVPGKRVTVKVVNPYACTMSRNYMRNPFLAKAIRMTRIPHHFIFSVESVGMHKPAVLVAEALKVLQQKCTALLELTKQEQDAF